MYNSGGVIIELDTSQSSSDYGKTFYGQKTREVLVYKKHKDLHEIIENQQTEDISPMLPRSECTLSQMTDENQQENNDDAKEPDSECEILTKETLKRPYVF